MANSHNPGSRSNDPGRKENYPGNAFASNTDRIPFHLEKENNEMESPGEISASTRFGDEIDGTHDEMERINRESEIRREKRQHPETPNMHQPGPAAKKGENSMWD